MKRSSMILWVLLILSPVLAQGQERPTAEVVGDLPTEIAGTSTLFFLDGKLWSCNDHGSLVLYALDTLSGIITDSIVLPGSIYDLEEVTQDDEYLYFGDIGDNNGVRNDLHVLRLEKATLVSDTVTFDTLWFSYPDRADSNARDFDCEAFVATDTALIFFTKQWLSQGSSCYSIPKAPGHWEAQRLFDIATEGMVTGASYQPKRGRLVLCGYNMLCMPFVYLFDGFSGDDFVGGRQARVELTNGIGWQTEGVATTDGLHYYLTCEHLDAYGITHPAQLLTLDLTAFINSATLIPNHYAGKMPALHYPNPTTGVIYLPTQGVKAATIVDMQGRKISEFRIQNSEIEIDLSSFPTGTYVLRITCEDGRERGEVVIVDR
jgi:uncharacterized protein YjfI (DUF2170 family)